MKKHTAKPATLYDVLRAFNLPKKDFMTTETKSLTRPEWLAEVCRLLVTKYDIKWSEKAVADYAEALAETFWEDGEAVESPDDAIAEDFAAGL